MKPGVTLGLLVIVCMLGSSCSQRNEPDNAQQQHTGSRSAGLIPGYTLDTPDQSHILPDILNEASGLTDVSSTEVAMVQDEIGTIFLYDIAAREVVKRVPFGPLGDYEGMTRVNESMFVLESKGHLYQVRNWLSDPTVTKHQLSLPTADNEGLCFDPIENRLLLSPKSRWQKGKAGKTLRPIFAVDIESGHLLRKPAFTLETNDIIDFAIQHKLDIPRKTNKKGEVRLHLKFKPASLAVHPVTHDIFVVSAEDQLLVSFNRQEEITGVQFLDEKTFPKPEGITFLPDASLVIMSEAAGGKPRLRIFNWHRDAAK